VTCVHCGDEVWLDGVTLVSDRGKRCPDGSPHIAENVGPPMQYVSDGDSSVGGDDAQ
jgi:hypothetical protein